MPSRVAFASISFGVLTAGVQQRVTHESCVGLNMDKSGAFVTLPMQLGKKNKNIKPVVDTGSDLLLVQKTLVGSSAQSLGKKGTITYGSGDVEVEMASDVVTFNAKTNNETIFIMQNYASNSAFSNIEGIFPLAFGDYNYIHTSKFSVCFSATGGSLQMSSSRVSVPADARWLAETTGMSVGDTKANIGKSMVLPDTGTTLIVGPLEETYTIFSLGCKLWEKCTEGNDPGSNFITALRTHGCTHEPPAFKWHLGHETVTITSKSYLYKRGGKCEIAWEVDAYMNMWILGMPLFFEYNVAFDAKAKKIGFSQGTCNNCGGHGSLLEAHHSLNGPARWPTSMPTGGEQLNEKDEGHTKYRAFMETLAAARSSRDSA